MKACFNITKPLDHSNDKQNNQIYNFSPENVQPELSELDSIDSSRHLKRVKSTKRINDSNSKFNIPRKPSTKRRNRKPVIRLSNLESPDFKNSNPMLPFSDTEFSFTSSSDSDMDLESLPDLVEDNNTPLSSPQQPPTPSHTFLERPGRIFDHQEKGFPKNKVQIKLQKQLELSRLESTPEYKPPSIFEIPEIAYKIVEYAAIQNDNSPKEVSPIRRRPLSFKHALLIHGNKELAKKSMENIPSLIYPKSHSNILYNCLTVNKLFNAIANELISKKFYFNDEENLSKFLQGNAEHNMFKPTEFKLHRLFNLKTHHFDSLFPKFDVSNLSKIEIFMCPKFLPPQEFYHSGHNIKQIVISGSKILDDNYLMMVSKMCPNLEVLDIRGCDMVTDAGVYHLGKNCSKLTTVNLGRKVKGHLITDAGVHKLVTNNQNLITVGLAGCYITDKSIWDLTINNSTSLQRLSLNNCPFITNQSIPLILHADYLPNLNVLEIRFTKIDNLRSIIDFKRRQEFKGISILIELCESLCLKMRQQEVEMDKAISQRIFNDIQDWANDQDDGDSCYHSLLSSRSVSI